jgi:hypothetical protein
MRALDLVERLLVLPCTGALLKSAKSTMTASIIHGSK